MAHLLLGPGLFSGAIHYFQGGCMCWGRSTPDIQDGHLTFNFNDGNPHRSYSEPTVGSTPPGCQWRIQVHNHSPFKNMILWVVTVTGWGVDPGYRYEGYPFGFTMEHSLEPPSNPGKIAGKIVYDHDFARFFY